jgi:hypothetical protein
MSRGVRLAIGITMIVLGGLALLGTIALLAVFGFDSTATSPSFQIRGNGRAVVWGTGLIREATPLPSRFSNSITLQVTAGDKDVFVGIGPTQEVARYLVGASVDRVTSVGWPGRVIVTEPRPGEAAPPPPDQQSFWSAKASGSGTQTLEWTIQTGAWTAVVMNADASPGIDAQGTGSLHIGAIGWVMLVLAIIALGLVGGGIAVLVTGRRRRRSRSSGAPAPPVGTATVAEPWGPIGESRRPDVPPANPAPAPPSEPPPESSPAPPTTPSEPPSEPPA